MNLLAERTYTTVDKSDWGEGPWQHEADKIQWVDEATGLDCMVIRGPMGNWCGYVGIPPGHRLHGVDYEDVAVGAHGGLTYADRCQEGVPEAKGICHVPEPGRPADVWWFGFDCGHAGDLMPGLNADFKRMVGRPRSTIWADTYRDVDYVRGEVVRLAQQLAAIEGRPPSP